MAEFIQSIVSTVGTVTTTKTINDANMLRFTNWVWSAYPQFEADGKTLKAKTNGNVGDAIADYHEKIWQGTKANVLRYERELAAKTAADEVPDLPAS